MTDAQRRSGRVRALLVDDSPGFRRELRLLLELEEVVVVGEAANGWEAVRLAQELEPDVILMDQNMPALSGVDATRKIKRQAPRRRVIFVAAEGEWEEEALRAGAEAYFVKDSDLTALLRAIQDPLAGLRTRALPRLGAAAGRLHPKFLLGTAGFLAASLLAALALWPSVALPGLALLLGMVFFIYGLKYYATNVLILLATGSVTGNGNGNGNGHARANGLRNGLRKANGNGNGRKNGNGLNGFGLTYAGNGNGNGRLKVQPFVSIHLPVFNEPEVIDRLLTACTNLDYDNYEVVVADDSTDETTDILRQRWDGHPRIKISHRQDRSGFKGGALRQALRVTDPEAAFVAVFDADFLPPPDILHQFLAYFYGVNGNGNGHRMGHGNGNGHGMGHGNGGDEAELRLIDDRVAVVQGYQWHVLNASENWITKGIRSEFSGSYVVERSGQELVGAMKMISGSVFMIRADVLREHGWGTSITEDWELTLRLYLDGYKVLYTPFIQAPSECVANFKQLARQRMRWAEGHTFNVKKYFWQVLGSAKLSLREKLEFLYYAPYYLQSALFMLGTSAWLSSELLFKFELSFWTEALGWALVFANASSLVLMNLTGLFLERGIQRNWTGIFSFVLLTYLLVPYQAYAAIKGLLEPHEGGWHRTQKTGVITEAIDRLSLKKRMRVLRPKHRKPRSRPRGRLAAAMQSVGPKLPRPLRLVGAHMNLARRLATVLIIGLAALALLSQNVTVVSASPDKYYLHPTATSGISPTGEYMNITSGTGNSTKAFNAVGNSYWYSDLAYPTGDDDASIAAGAYTFNMYFSQLPTQQAPQVDAVSTGDTRPSTLTISHTTGTGSDRLMMVGISILNDEDEKVAAAPTGVTYAGQPLIKVTEVARADDARVEIWYLVNPPSGAADVVITFTAPLRRVAMAGVVTFTGVHQSTPLGTPNTSTGSSSTASVSVTSGSNELVFDTVTCETCTSLAVGAGQTQQWNQARLDGSRNSVGAGSTEPGATSVAMTWGLGYSDHWAIAGVSIKPSGGSAPVVAAATSGQTQRTSITIPHTTSGSQRLMLVGVTINNNGNETVSSVTYAGEDLAQVGSVASTNNVRVEIWRRIAPATGLNNVVITFSSNLNNGAKAGVVTFTGVDQSTPLGTFASASGTSAGPATVDVTSAANELVFDTVGCEGNDTLTLCSGLTPGGGQTQQWNLTALDGPTSGEQSRSAGSIKAGAASVTMSWTISPAASVPWAILAVPIKPAAPSVDIKVYLDRTKEDGSEPFEIRPATLQTITSSTANPLALDLGSAVQQNFSKANRQRLRLRIEVTAVNNGGSFTLAYDGTPDPSETCPGTNCSYLATPTVTVPEWGVALLLLVPLIPLLVSMIWRRRKLAGALASGCLSVIFAVSMLASQVAPTTAAPDTYYLHPTATSGINPAGEYMNITPGSGDSTKVFNATGDTYWYSDVAYPTGGDPGSIAAGPYTHNMYFSARPGAPQVVTTNTSATTTAGTSHTLNLPTGIQSGDLLIAMLSGFIGTDSTPVDINWPAGWTEFFEQDASTSTMHLAVAGAYRKASGSEGASITVTTTVSVLAAHNSYRITGAEDPAIQAPQAASIGYTDTASTIDPPSLTPTGGAKNYLWLAVAGWRRTGVTRTTSPSNYTNAIEASSGGSSSGTRLASLRRELSAASEDPGAFTLSSTSERRVGVTIAVHPASGPLVDATNTGTTNGGSSITIPHTTSGTNRLMLVGVSINNDNMEEVQSVTWKGSESLTQVGWVINTRSGNDDARVEIWRLVNPSTGSGNVVVTFNTTLLQQAVAGVMTFTGVNQSTPLGTFASNENDGTPATVSVTSATGELVFGVVGTEYGTLTTDPGQTERWNIQVGASDTRGAGSTKAGASTVNLQWTVGSGTHWAAAGVSIKPVVPSVNITVYVDHTKADGTSPVAITSASTTITPSTANPLALNLGSGVLQTFYASDPRRIRLRIQVTAVNNAGSFTLAYDGTCGSNRCSNLDTPVVVVPEGAVALIAVGILIPVVTARSWRRRRLVARARMACSPFSKDRRVGRRDRTGTHGRKGDWESSGCA